MNKFDCFIMNLLALSLSPFFLVKNKNPIEFTQSDSFIHSSIQRGIHCCCCCCSTLTSKQPSIKDIIIIYHFQCECVIFHSVLLLTDIYVELETTRQCELSSCHLLIVPFRAIVVDRWLCTKIDWLHFWTKEDEWIERNWRINGGEARDGESVCVHGIQPGSFY